jgi:predicted transcriptional regulator
MRHKMTRNSEGSPERRIASILRKQPDLPTHPSQAAYLQSGRKEKAVDVNGARTMNLAHLAECQEQERLSADLAQAIRDLLEMQESQIAALKLGDQRIGRFDEEIAVALRVWKQARRAYMRDLEAHGCLGV